MPTFSVIVPVYNAERFLDESLASVREQSVRDLEILVVDDCSKDTSWSIVARHVGEDSRIRPISTVRNSGGPARPKNVGLLAAEGEFVSFLDHDDIDVSTKLERALELLRAYPQYDAVFFDVYPMDDSGKVGDKGSLSDTRFTARAAPYLTEVAPRVYACAENYIGSMVLNGSAISTQGLVARRQAFLEKVGLFDESYRILDDTVSWFRLARNCRLLYVDEPKCYYRQIATSVSTRINAMRLEAARLHTSNYKLIDSLLSDDERDSYRRYIADIFASLGWLHRESKGRGISFHLESLRWKCRWIDLWRLTKALGRMLRV